jgi:lysophospholipase L1-like esterase
MAQEPFFEMAPLETDLAGNVEIPTLGTSDGKAIYCVYSNNIDSIWIQSTSDAGKTWSEPVQVMGLPSPRYITDANVLVDGERITVFATHVLDLPDEEGKFARSVFQVSVSEDGGRTWSPPQPMPIDRNYVVGCIHAPIWLDGDTVVMGYSWDVPAEEEKPAATEGGMYLKSGLLISHDRGRTWTPGADVEVDKHPIGADEPATVRLTNGDLFMVVRTSHPRPYETLSRDGGQTWEPPQPSRFHGYNSPTALLRLRDGAIVRAWDNSPTDRFPLVVSLSTDHCRTWTPPRTVTEPAVLEDGALSFQRACYPSLAQAADGTILMAWWQRTTDGVNSVWVARLNRAWIEETSDMPAPLKLVAFGDSVTRGVRPGVTEYQTFRHLLQQRLTEEGTPVRVINAGVGSDTTARALERLRGDVLAEQPALVTVMFGVNDAAMVDGGPVARTEPRVPLDGYRENLRTIISRIRDAGAQVLLCTPTPMSREYAYQNIGAYAENEDMNFMLRQYAAAVRDIATEMHVECVDLFRTFTERPDGLELIEDGCHPYVRGHLLIADELLGPVGDLLRTAPKDR